MLRLGIPRRIISLDDLKSMAVEAVLLLQGKINDEDGNTVTMRLLVPSKVIGSIIGKSGAIINEIQKRTKADIRISNGKKPKCADESDEIVEIFGEVGNVRDTLVQIVLRLRDDVLKDREDVHNSSAGACYDHRADSGTGLALRSSAGYEYVSSLMADNIFGSLCSRSSSLYEGLPPLSAMEMVIPAHAVGKVMGKGGTNIENIRKISGAAIEISDTKSSRGDRVALISGTSDQKRSAENMIQAFIMAT